MSRRDGGSASRPTVRDVAKVAGVSFKTVARVVNGEAVVRPETAERVMAAIRQLGFQRNAVAATLKRGVSADTIGLVIDDVSNPFFATLSRAIEDMARSHGLQVIIASSDRDPKRERALIGSLVAQRLGGLLVVPVGRDHRYLARELRMGTAVVFLDRPQAHLRADSVTVDDHDGARRATQHLVAHGHRRIAILTEPLDVHTMVERLRGFRDALAEAHVSVDERLVRSDLKHVDDAALAASELVRMARPPSAIFGTNNRMTIGALGAIAASGRRVAVVGFDDFELATALSIPVTVVRPDVRRLGQVGTELLLRRMRGWRGAPERIVLPVELVARGSGEIEPPVGRRMRHTRTACRRVSRPAAEEGNDMTTGSTDGAYEHVAFTAAAADRALDAGAGVMRLAPAWVPRAFCTPGRRIRLHPDDYYPFGFDRGGVDERWLASAIRADNGPRTGPFEGLSLVVDPEGSLLPFDEFVAHHGAELIGERLWTTYGRWPMYSKFFDNQQALPFHFHHRDEDAARVGKTGKPEAYYYSPHMNNTLGDQAISFLGLHPETTRAQLRERLERFSRGGDNHITDLSRGYRTQLGTGWDIPVGVLHAPASICTYEPQAASDVFCMCESWSNNREVPEELMWKDVPEDRVGDLDYIIDLLDWERNVDPEFVTNRFMTPYETAWSRATGAEAVERWVVYLSVAASAKELIVRPGATVTVPDTDAYGLIVVQGHGSVGALDVEAATTIRFGELSSDELFVSEPAARDGVTVTNRSSTQALVMLKHFGPGNRSLAEDGPPDSER